MDDEQSIPGFITIWKLAYLGALRAIFAVELEILAAAVLAVIAIKPNTLCIDGDVEDLGLLMGHGLPVGRTFRACRVKIIFALRRRINTKLAQDVGGADYAMTLTGNPKPFATSVASRIAFALSA